MSEFVDYRSEFQEYEKNFPMQEMQLKNGPFRYILAGPANAKHTLVFLNGGMNSNEMWLRYVKDLSKDYRVLSFDYPMMYGTDASLLDGMHELFGKLSVYRVVLVGASMGGIIAQLYAQRHPQDVEGLCLMSTAGLTSGAMKKFGKLLGLLTIVIGLMKICPYSWFIRGEKKQCANYVAEADDDAKAYFQDMFDHIYDSYTKEMDIHVTKLMRDFKNQSVCSKKDFTFLAGKVLLLLPEDDSAFPPELQQELIEEMTDPTVIPGIKGGHLTTMLHDKDNVGYIRKFLEENL